MPTYAFAVCCLPPLAGSHGLFGLRQFSYGTLEPRDIGTPSRSTGTLEPRDIGTPCKTWPNQVLVQLYLAIWNCTGSRNLEPFLPVLLNAWIYCVLSRGLNDTV